MSAPSVWVYYEEDVESGQLLPQRMNIYFGPGVIRWDKSYYYQQLTAPFQRRTPADWYDEDVLSLTISAGELVRREDRPGYFGIHIPSLAARIEKQRREARRDFDQFGDVFNYEDVAQFIITIADLEEIMQMEVRSFYEWR